jgi:transcriptional regulator with XRE-family HTH domain
MSLSFGYARSFTSFHKFPDTTISGLSVGENMMLLVFLLVTLRGGRMSKEASDTTKLLGETLKELREALGLSQEELAKEINTSRSFFAQIETGRTKLPKDRFGELVAVFMKHIKRVGFVDVDPSLLFAIKRLEIAVSGGDIGDKTRNDSFMAFYETRVVMTRILESLVKGEELHPPLVIAPLTGLLLLYPDLETSLLIHLLAIPSQHKTLTERKIDTLTNYYFLVALYTANESANLFADKNDVILELAIDELSSQVQNRKKHLAIQEIIDIQKHNSGFLHFLEALVKIPG